MGVFSDKSAAAAVAPRRPLLGGAARQINQRVALLRAELGEREVDVAFEAAVACFVYAGRRCATGLGATHGEAFADARRKLAEQARCKEPRRAG